jgi:VWFA-related protein
MYKSLSAMVFIVFSAFTAAAQTSERIDVNVVLLDTVVTDNRGNQILGLTKDDFVVTEDGVRQTVDSVDYFSTRRLLTEKEEAAPFKVEQVREERYFIFFFDKPEQGQLFGELTRARRAVEEFIERDMGEKDLVAIAGHDRALRIYSDFTSNKNLLRKALADSATFKTGIDKVTTEGPSIVREIGEGRVSSVGGTVYEALEALADAVRPIRARKNLVLFSAGIVEPSEEVRNGVLLGESRYFDPMISALNAANVTVYAKNLFTNSPTEPVFHQTLERIADATNGEYWRNSVSYDPVLKEVEKASGGYYLITYRSNKPRGARGFQKVDVKVVNPEFRVKARAGYAYGG